MEVRRNRLPRDHLLRPCLCLTRVFPRSAGLHLFTLEGAWQASLEEYPGGRFCVGAPVSISPKLSCFQAGPGSQHCDVEGPKFYFQCLVSERCDPNGSPPSPSAAATAANPDLGCLQELLFVCFFIVLLLRWPLRAMLFFPLATTDRLTKGLWQGRCEGQGHTEETDVGICACEGAPLWSGPLPRVGASHGTMAEVGGF